MDGIRTAPIRQVVPVLLLYVLISILGMYYHELALEEAQFFLLARDSDSLSSLYHNMQYEGHPRLWCALLFFITHFITSSYIGMQVLHLMITTATVFLFLRYAPFRMWMKAFIIGGYYFLFEYDILSRNYAPGILVLFVCCLQMSRAAATVNRRESSRRWSDAGLTRVRDLETRRGLNLPLMGLLLVLLCNTHLFFAFAAAGIYISLLVEYAGQGKIFSRSFLLFSLLFVAGFVTALVQLQVPSADRLFTVKWSEGPTRHSMVAASYALIRGWFPIPAFSGENFWNSYWLSDETTGGIVRVILFIFSLLFPALVLRRSSRAQVFYYTVIFLLLGFFLFLPMVASRYFGVEYVCFIAACWMAGQGSRDFFAFRRERNPTMRNALQVTTWLILAVQLVIGGYALAQDIGRPFSQAKNAVAFIKEQQLETQELIVDGYIAGPALSVYSGKKLYYLATGERGSFCVWKKINFPQPPSTVEEEIERSDLVKGLDRFILISNRPMTAGLIRLGDAHFRFVPLASFTNSITPLENSYIYQAIRKT
ncbi:MAG TPA: hypothetical protein VNU72_03185 [Puia sp.]|nr:hypothetical protein [Puia sp.]